MITKEQALTYEIESLGVIGSFFANYFFNLFYKRFEKKWKLYQGYHATAQLNE